MYEFAILALGGLIVAKSVDLLGHLGLEGMHKAAKLFVSAVVGFAYAYLFDYSVFAAWDVAVRSEFVGTLGTGLFMAGLAGVWHEALVLMREWAHRYHGEATEIEARMHRAA